MYKTRIYVQNVSSHSHCLIIMCTNNGKNVKNLQLENSSLPFQMSQLVLIRFNFGLNFLLRQFDFVLYQVQFGLMNSIWSPFAQNFVHNHIGIGVESDEIEFDPMINILTVNIPTLRCQINVYRYISKIKITLSKGKLSLSQQIGKIHNDLAVSV